MIAKQILEDWTVLHTNSNSVIDGRLGQYNSGHTTHTQSTFQPIGLHQDKCVCGWTPSIGHIYRHKWGRGHSNGTIKNELSIMGQEIINEF